ncbi:hypothetical protein BKA69DRAFT_1040232 [Paraphysoderma sedebokerense]|nr:hypothetical protein BKA69DRAFT_1040232 [Paraphysoderma sedebokerense]
MESPPHSTGIPNSNSTNFVRTKSSKELRIVSTRLAKNLLQNNYRISAEAVQSVNLYLNELVTKWTKQSSICGSSSGNKSDHRSSIVPSPESLKLSTIEHNLANYVNEPLLSNLKEVASNIVNHTTAPTFGSRKESLVASEKDGQQQDGLKAHSSDGSNSLPSPQSETFSPSSFGGNSVLASAATASSQFDLVGSNPSPVSMSDSSSKPGSPGQPSIMTTQQVELKSGLAIEPITECMKAVFAFAMSQVGTSSVLNPIYIDHNVVKYVHAVMDGLVWYFFENLINHIVTNDKNAVRVEEIIRVLSEDPCLSSGFADFGIKESMEKKQKQNVVKQHQSPVTSVLDLIPPPPIIPVAESPSVSTSALPDPTTRLGSGSEPSLNGSSNSNKFSSFPRADSVRSNMSNNAHPFDNSTSSFGRSDVNLSRTGSTTSKAGSTVNGSIDDFDKMVMSNNETKKISLTPERLKAIEVRPFSTRLSPKSPISTYKSMSSDALDDDDEELYSDITGRKKKEDKESVWDFLKNTDPESVLGTSNSSKSGADISRSSTGKSKKSASEFFFGSGKSKKTTNRKSNSDGQLLNESNTSAGRSQTASFDDSASSKSRTPSIVPREAEINRKVSVSNHSSTGSLDKSMNGKSGNGKNGNVKLGKAVDELDAILADDDQPKKTVSEAQALADFFKNTAPPESGPASNPVKPSLSMRVKKKTLLDKFKTGSSSSMKTSSGKNSGSNDSSKTNSPAAKKKYVALQVPYDFGDSTSSKASTLVATDHASSMNKSPSLKFREDRVKMLSAEENNMQKRSSSVGNIATSTFTLGSMSDLPGPNTVQQNESSPQITSHAARLSTLARKQLRSSFSMEALSNKSQEMPVSLSMDSVSPTKSNPGYQSQQSTPPHIKLIAPSPSNPSPLSMASKSPQDMYNTLLGAVSSNPTLSNRFVDDEAEDKESERENNQERKLSAEETISELKDYIGSDTSVNPSGSITTLDRGSSTTSNPAESALQSHESLPPQAFQNLYQQPSNEFGKGSSDAVYSTEVLDLYNQFSNRNSMASRPVSQRMESDLKNSPPNPTNPMSIASTHSDSTTSQNSIAQPLSSSSIQHLESQIALLQSQLSSAEQLIHNLRSELNNAKETMEVSKIKFDVLALKAYKKIKDLMSEKKLYELELNKRVEMLARKEQEVRATNEALTKEKEKCSKLAVENEELNKEVTELRERLKAVVMVLGGAVPGLIGNGSNGNGSVGNDGQKV